MTTDNKIIWRHPTWILKNLSLYFDKIIVIGDIHGDLNQFYKILYKTKIHIFLFFFNFFLIFIFYLILHMTLKKIKIKICIFRRNK